MQSMGTSQTAGCPNTNRRSVRMSHRVSKMAIKPTIEELGFICEKVDEQEFKFIQFIKLTIL
jgi:CO dehydrogenase nickel-insertion accessory protein CooC1